MRNAFRTLSERLVNTLYARYLCSRALGLKAKRARDDRVFGIQLYARYFCSRDTLGLNAAGRPSAARDDKVSCIQVKGSFTNDVIG